MILSQWLRQAFDSRGPIARAARGGKSRSSSRHRAAPGLEAMENRLLFSVMQVTSLQDGTLAELRGNGHLDLREAIELATRPNVEVDGYINSDLTNTIRFRPWLDGQTINLAGIGDRSVGNAVFGVNNGAQLTIDGQTGLTEGITIARPQNFTTEISGIKFTFPVPAFRLAHVHANSGLTLKGLTVNGFVARGGGGGSGQGAGGGAAAGMGGVVFNQGALTIVNSTLTDNVAQGGTGGLRDPHGFFQEGPGSGGGGLLSGGGGTTHTQKAGGGGGSPNPGVGGTGWGDNGTPGGFGGGGGGGSRDQFIAQLVGRGGNGGFGGGGGGGGSDGTCSINSDYKGDGGGNGGFGGGGGAAGFGAQGSDVQGPGGFGGGGGNFGGGGGGGAGMGGVVFNTGGTVTVTNSTFTGNSALGGPGGVGIGGDGTAGKGMGGTIFSRNGSVTITNGTISGNTAADGGRGVFLFGDDGAFTARINKTIIGQGDTSVSDLAADTGGTGSGDFAGSGGNLIRTTTVFGSPFDIATDTLTGDPLLGALQDNGGIVRTMAPQAGSPVIGLNIGATPINVAQTITFAALPSRTFGDAAFAIGATSTSALPVSFTASGNATVAQVDGVWTVRITGAGSATITATQAGNNSFAPAAGVSQTFTIAKAASATTTLGAGPFTYNAAEQGGGSGTVSGVGGLNTGATSLTYSVNADGTGVADRTNVGTYYVTAHYAGDADHLASSGTAVAIRIVAKHITGTFTAADKVYDNTTAATVTSRSLVGVAGTDVVSLTGGAATFASKNAGTHTVTLAGATLGGAAAGNYILDSVATTTATISPKALTGLATMQGEVNVKMNGSLSFRIDLDRSGIVDGQSVAQLFDGASFGLTVGGRPYGVRAAAVVVDGFVTVDVAMTSELKAILAASTTATKLRNAPTVAFTLAAASNDGNYTLAATASTKLFNTGR